MFTFISLFHFNAKIDALLKMAICQYQFEAIHAFRDGNGRAGRIFNIQLLVQKGLLDLPILFLSRYIMDHKDEYYSNLAGVSQRGDWASWLIYMLKAVESTSNLTYQKINDIIEVKDAISNEIEKNTELRKIEQLVQVFFTKPFTKVKHLVAAGLYAENTARDYLNKLSVIGVLEKKSINGHFYYLNSELNRILAE